MQYSRKTQEETLIAEALAALVRQRAGEPVGAGIGVVWTRARSVVDVAFTTRLDTGVPTGSSPGADHATVVAVAPPRVAAAVLGRCLVVCDELESAGLPVHAVHVARLRIGSSWRLLRRPAPAGSARVVPCQHQARLLRHRYPSRVLDRGGRA